MVEGNADIKNFSFSDNDSNLSDKKKKSIISNLILKSKPSLNLATAIDFNFEHCEILFPNRLKSKIYYSKFAKDHFFLVKYFCILRKLHKYFCVS